MAIKSLEDLRKIKAAAKQQTETRKLNEKQIIIGMGTCGIAAGARPVMEGFKEEIGKRGLNDVTVSQTGCIGMCRLEPMVDVYVPGREKVTYVHMSPDKVGRVVAEHIVNGRPVAEYTIGAAEEKK